MLMSSGPFTLRKVIEHSVATAFATRVLPVPTSKHGGCRKATFNYGCTKHEYMCGQILQLHRMLENTSQLIIHHWATYLALVL